MNRALRFALATSATALAVLGLAACSGGGATTPVGTWGNPDARGEASLEFAEDGNYSGSDGCNRVMGSWEADGDGFVVSPMATTLMACPDVEVWLVDPATVQVQGDTLHVFDASGAELGTLERN